MKLSDYIVEYLLDKDIKVVFGYPGGMITHLMDSFNKYKEIETHFTYNEQGAAFAACGYAQASQKIGLAFATSGPGATNLITGICHAYYESVPTIFITGQVNTFESKKELNLRQLGFQETNIVDMVKRVTNYSVYIDDKNKVKYELDKAIHYATNGRIGPVLLDIPMDIQSSNIEVEQLIGFKKERFEQVEYKKAKRTILSELNKAKKPILILGNGINMSGMRKYAKELIEKLGIPTVTSMISVDLLDGSNNNNYGFIGAYGGRAANLILSQADLIISLGSRLGSRQIGSNTEEFSNIGKLIRIDIDEFEFERQVKDDEIDLLIDLKNLIPNLLEEDDIVKTDFHEKWINQCNYYREKLSGIDIMKPNRIVEKISSFIVDDSLITTDVGQNQVWVAQSFKVKSNQRVLFSGGHGAMGFSLPAAIGAYYATKKPVYCITGDGGFQMNIQELQFIVRENIPIKIIILNNSSLGMIRHFQEMYFEDNCSGTIKGNGYSSPSFVNISKAYGINAFKIKDESEFDKYTDIFKNNSPALFDIEVGNCTYVYPKLVFKKPMYDQDPPLDRQLLEDILNYEG